MRKESGKLQPPDDYTLRVTFLRQHSEDDETAGGSSPSALALQLKRELQEAMDNGDIAGQFVVYLYSEGRTRWDTAIHQADHVLYKDRPAWPLGWEPL